MEKDISFKQQPQGSQNGYINIRKIDFKTKNMLNENQNHNEIPFHTH